MVASALILALVGAAGAHDLLIDPSHEHMDARAVVSMRLFLGHSGEGQAVRPDRSQAETYVCVTPDGVRHEPRAEGTKLDVFDATAAGVYVFGYATKPRLVHSATAELLEIVADAGRTEDLAKSIKARHMVRPWRLEERHHAKSVVVAGKGGVGKADRSLDLDLELSLERRPDELQPGTATRLRVLRAGVPAPGMRVLIQRRGIEGVPTAATSDADGYVRFAPADGGAWVIRTVRLVGAPRKHTAEWIVERATLTFETPERKAPSSKPAKAAQPAVKGE